MNRNIISSLLTLLLLCASNSLAQEAGWITRTDYQNSDGACNIYVRNFTFLVGVCANGYQIGNYFSDGRKPDITVTFYNTSGCTGNNSVTANAEFTSGQCIVGGDFNSVYTYSSVIPTIQTGLYTFTQFNPNEAGCNTLYAVTQQAPICYKNPVGRLNSEKKVCSGTGAFVVTTCTDDACSEGCVDKTQTIQNTCDPTTHSYSTCKASPGSPSAPPSPTATGDATATGGSTNPSDSNTATNGNTAAATSSSPSPSPSSSSSSSSGGNSQSSSASVIGATTIMLSILFSLILVL